MPGKTALAGRSVRREKVFADHATSDAARVVRTGLAARRADGAFHAIAAKHSASGKRTAAAIDCTSSEIGLVARVAGFAAADVAVLTSGTRVAGRPLGVRLPPWWARFTQNPFLTACVLAKLCSIRAVKTVLVQSIGLLPRVACFTSATFACPASRTRLACRFFVVESRKGLRSFQACESSLPGT